MTKGKKKKEISERKKLRKIYKWIDTTNMINTNKFHLYFLERNSIFIQNNLNFLLLKQNNYTIIFLPYFIQIHLLLFKEISMKNKNKKKKKLGGQKVNIFKQNKGTHSK